MSDSENKMNRRNLVKVGTLGAIGATVLAYQNFTGVESAVTTAPTLSSVTKSILLNSSQVGTSLKAMLAVIGSAQATLVIDNEVNVDTGVIPTNISIVIVMGGRLHQGSNNLNIQGPFEAGLYQVFDCTAASGRISFNYSPILEVYPQWWGAKGDGVSSTGKWTFDRGTDNYLSIQAAVYACNIPAFTMPNGPSTVRFPRGNYLVSKSINISGCVTLEGEGVPDSFGGARIVMTSDNTHLFVLTNTSGIVFRSLSMKAQSKSYLAGTSLVYIPNKSVGPNSTYFRECWFSTPEDFAINCCMGDDLQIVNCTFDVSTKKFIKIGDSDGPAVPNVFISGNTFYAGQTQTGSFSGCINLINAKNFTFSNNRVYGGKIPYVIDALRNGAKSPQNILITGNITDGANSLLLTGTGYAVITGNHCTGITSSVVSIGSGLPVRNLVVTGNSFSGYSSVGGIIDASGTPLIDSVIRDNLIVANSGGETKYPVNLPHANNSGLKIGSNRIVTSNASTAYFISGKAQAEAYNL